MTVTTNNRWLRFNFDDPTHRSLKILGGTSISIGEDIVTFEEDTVVNISDYLGEEGADYYVFINKDGRITASLVREPVDGYVFIGQFHTLCLSVPANTTAIVPTAKTIVGDIYLIQDYSQLTDEDFYNFYAKPILSINLNTNYNTATVDHPLAGFNAGDILPESVWCLNFHPTSKIWEGSVYDRNFNIAADIYLQSGIGEFSRSEYGSQVTIYRLAQNYIEDAKCVGKRFFEYDEYTDISLGSNQKTNCGNYDGLCGGHVDTADRRMISFLGCEDCCGYLGTICGHLISQEKDDPSIEIYVSDGVGNFGLTDDIFLLFMSGVTYNAANFWQGSRSLNNFPIKPSTTAVGTTCTRRCCSIAIV